jgi:hypothetical protein
MVVTKTSRDFVHTITLPKMKRQWEVDKWCTEQFGPRWEAVGYREGVWCCFWKGRSIPGSYEWLFANEQDANWFMLKWGGNGN